MPRYKAIISVEHTFTTSEDIDFEVEADSQEEAEKLMYFDYTRYTDPDSFNADHDGSCITDSTIELIEGEDETATIPRCKKTQDMFIS